MEETLNELGLERPVEMDMVLDTQSWQVRYHMMGIEDPVSYFSKIPVTVDCDTGDQNADRPEVERAHVPEEPRQLICLWLCFLSMK